MIFVVTSTGCMVNMRLVQVLWFLGAESAQECQPGLYADFADGNRIRLCKCNPGAAKNLIAAFGKKIAGTQVRLVFKFRDGGSFEEIS